MTPEELKSWRQSLNISQTKAAEQFGVTLSQYWKWESGNAPVPRSVEIILNLLKGE